MALEKKWEAQGPVPFLNNGGQDGLVVLQDVLQFKVKQKVIIASATQPPIELEVKKIISPTSLYVGPVNVTPGGSRSLDTRTNISAYLVADSAFIRAPEQSKSIPPQADIVRAVYEQEPTTAIRTMVVDKIGRPITGANPLPITGSISVSVGDNAIPLIYNFNSPITPNTEFSIVLPATTKRFLLKSRDGNAKCKIGFNPGDTTSNYWTIRKGNTFDSNAVDISSMTTIYLQADKASQTIEVVVYYTP